MLVYLTAGSPASQPGDDVLLVCPGIVYRPDAIDWQHTGTPHQLDLWRITRQAMSSTDMDLMIAILLGALVPGLPHRQQPRTHPYTLDGRQVDVYHGGRWVEVGECGLAHPSVLATAGPHGRSGLAVGIGLDRLFMLVKHISDIRLLRSGDPRITGQMLDLARYQQVSLMPPITRDLSVAAWQDDDEETLGDRVRDALGADTSCVEEVRVLSATAYPQLPAPAIGRLGVPALLPKPHQFGCRIGCLSQICQKVIGSSGHRSTASARMRSSRGLRALLATTSTPTPSRSSRSWNKPM
jgi:phenylalanyl-tRNA synthetase alpha chain